MTTAKSSKIIGILGRLFIVLSIGLSISVAAQDDPKGKEIGRDGDYIAYASGVVRDTKTGLEWITGRDENTNNPWNEGKQWVENLTVAGGGWRMPTRKELETLYEKGRGPRNVTPLLKTTGWYIWSGEIRDSLSAWRISLYTGNINWNSSSLSTYTTRVFAVRPRK